MGHHCPTRRTALLLPRIFGLPCVLTWFLCIKLNFGEDKGPLLFYLLIITSSVLLDSFCYPLVHCILNICISYETKIHASYILFHLTFT